MFLKPCTLGSQITKHLVLRTNTLKNKGITKDSLSEAIHKRTMFGPILNEFTKRGVKCEEPFKDLKKVKGGSLPV